MLPSGWALSRRNPTPRQPVQTSPDLLGGLIGGRILALMALPQFEPRPQPKLSRRDLRLVMVPSRRGDRERELAFGRSTFGF